MHILEGWLILEILSSRKRKKKIKIKQEYTTMKSQELGVHSLVSSIRFVNAYDNAM